MEEKNLPTKVDELMTELANKDPLVLASISAVPYFGSTLATFFSAKWLTIYQERTDALFQKFGEHLTSLDEQAIKQDYFNTDEGIDLLVKATEESAKTRSEEKRDLIARVLRGAVVELAGDKYSPEDYLYLISDLTVQELKVARSLYRDRPRFNSDAWNSWEAKVCGELGLDKSDLHMSLERLGSSGLLGMVTAFETEGDGLTVFSREEDEVGPFVVTSAFDKLMRFLQLERQQERKL